MLGGHKGQKECYKFDCCRQVVCTHLQAQEVRCVRSASKGTLRDKTTESCGLADIQETVENYINKTAIE